MTKHKRRAYDVTDPQGLLKSPAAKKAAQIIGGAGGSVVLLLIGRLFIDVGEADVRIAMVERNHEALTQIVERGEEALTRRIDSMATVYNDRLTDDAAKLTNLLLRQGTMERDLDRLEDRAERAQDGG